MHGNSVRRLACQQRPFDWNSKRSIRRDIQRVHSNKLSKSIQRRPSAHSKGSIRRRPSAHSKGSIRRRPSAHSKGSIRRKPSAHSKGSIQRRPLALRRGTFEGQLHNHSKFKEKETRSHVFGQCYNFSFMAFKHNQGCLTVFLLFPSTPYI